MVIGCRIYVNTVLNLKTVFIITNEENVIINEISFSFFHTSKTDKLLLH